MSLYEVIKILNLAIMSASLLVFLYMLYKGMLGEKQLRLNPTRDLHQPTAVYLVGIGGVLLYSMLLMTVTAQSPMELLLLSELLRFAMIGLLINRAFHAEAGFRKIGLLPRWPRRDCNWGVLGGFAALGIASALGWLINFITIKLGYSLDPVAHEALQTLRDEFSVGFLILLIFSAVIMAPPIEEILFRGIFQTSLLRLFKGSRWPALLIASAVFAVIHQSVTPWHGLIMLFFVGLIFGYLYESTGSLLTPILAHAVFNAANIAQLLSMPEQLPQ